MALILARKIRQYRSIVSILQQSSKKKFPSGSRPQSKRYYRRRVIKDDEVQHIFQQDRRCWYPSSVIIKPQKETRHHPYVIRGGLPVQATSTS